MENHSYVEVRKHGSSIRYKAKVEAIGHECDLATLFVENKEFWEDMDPLELGDDVPFVNEEVSVLGYPSGTYALNYIALEFRMSINLVGEIDLTNNELCHALKCRW